MRTFIIRARKGTTSWEKLKIAGKSHFEIIAHSVINAFFISNGFREDVEVYIILESAKNFPFTIKLSGGQGLSLSGFHEQAVLNLIEKTLQEGRDLQKDATLTILPGVAISGFGFEKLVKHLLKTHTLYLLDKKGEDIRVTKLAPNPVFILSDHLAMPKNSIKALKRLGVKTLSLGKKMLFASQCIVLIHDQLDRS